MLQNRQDIQQELTNLITAMPRLLQDNQGAGFWIEFLVLAETIKDHVPLDRRDLVITRIHEILASCGVAPPTWWVLASAAVPGRA